MLDVGRDAKRIKSGKADWTSPWQAKHTGATQYLSSRLK